MCTQSRKPTSSRRMLIASSKSCASSGSIVNVGSARRSTWSGSIPSGSVGSRSASASASAARPPAGRMPRWYSRPSSTGAIDAEGPSTRTTRARPPRRRVVTTTRSPTAPSAAEARSSTIGVRGSKYGSPTSSFPRRASSQTIGSPGRIVGVGAHGCRSYAASCSTRTSAAVTTPSSGRVRRSSYARTLGFRPRPARLFPFGVM